MAVSKTGARVFKFATKVEQETATESEKLISPATQQHHYSAAKSWVEFDPVTDIVGDSYGVSSIADVATGQTRINFDTDFSTGFYTKITTANAGSAGGANTLSSTVSLSDIITRNTTGAAVDVNPTAGVFFGDQ